MYVIELRTVVNGEREHEQAERMAAHAAEKVDQVYEGHGAQVIRRTRATVDPVPQEMRDVYLLEGTGE